MATVLTILVTTILFEFVLKNTIVRERFKYIYAFENIDNVTYNGTTLTGEEFSKLYFGGYKP
ncbi:MAG: hypothetical protein HUJ68_13995 [Clostridia bacterium]|nr:hypothetical protein [Clostridia bacterium]